MSKKEPTEKEIKEADFMDAIIEALADYFFIVPLPVSRNKEADQMELAIVTNKIIPIGDDGQNGLAPGFYLLDDKPPFRVLLMRLEESDDKDITHGELLPIPDGIAGDLNLFNLILHIYEAGDISNDVKRLIEDTLINDLSKGGELNNVKISADTTTLKPAIKTALMNAKTVKGLLWDEFRRPMDGQQTMIPQGTDENAGYSVVALKYMGDDVEIKKKLTDFDMIVYEAICNIYEWAHPTPGQAVKVTIEDIWCTINHIKDRHKLRISDKRREAIVKAIDKMRNTDTWINVKNEYGLAFPDNTSFTDHEYKGNLLFCDGMSYKENGVLKATYRVFRTPILFEYCQAKKQIINIPSALLDTSDTTSNTDKVLAFKNLLIKEIWYMRYAPQTDRKRLLSTLYEKTTLEEPASRKGKSDDIEIIRKILTSWKNRKEELNFIEDFYFTTPGKNEDGTPRQAKKGDPIDGVYILLPYKEKGIEQK